MSEQNTEKSLAELVEMLRKPRFAMMTTIDGDRMVTRPMGVQQVEDDATVWFFAEQGSDKAEQLRADARVNLAFADGDFLSLSGTGTVLQDAAKQEELWSPATKAWLQCEPTDPKVALIRVEAESIGYWDTPDAAGSLLSMAKGLVTGERPQGGDSGVVEL